MYIPDKEWDRLINEACEILEDLNLPVYDNFAREQIQIVAQYKYLLQAFINLQDSPIPIKKSFFYKIGRKIVEIVLKPNKD